MLEIGLMIIVVLMSVIWYGVITIVKKQDTEEKTVVYRGVKGERIEQ